MSKKDNSDNNIPNMFENQAEPNMAENQAEPLKFVTFVSNRENISIIFKGKNIQFDKRKYVTDDVEEIEYLRKHCGMFYRELR